ncbi:MAG: hypothetical protein HN509_14710 [Halobacteriovoraceae bacterium]|nr:hypothetical protein [Halobacteriovoraceae bacterium]MBT5094350.1 hypothetical protein [Halobacteriovoraceae bacterium]
MYSIEKRTFPDNSSWEIRKIENSWQIGRTKDGAWVPFEKGWTMNPVPFDTKNSDEIDIRGRGIQGKHVSIITPPIWYRGKNVKFKVIPEKTFPKQHIVPTGNDGMIVLDKKKYQKKNEKSGPQSSYTIYTEEGNPDATTVKRVMGLLSKKFPGKTKSMESPVIVSALNNREGIEAGIKASGFHRPPFVMLNSDEDYNTFTHRLHELGGLYRVDNQYAHGLTWFLAYDQTFKRDLDAKLKSSVSQTEKMLKVVSNLGVIEDCFDKDRSTYEKLQQLQGELNKQRCHLLTEVERYLKFSGRNPKAYQDDQHNLHNFVNRDVSNSYSIYAWGSARVWQLINLELEAKGQPTLYQLMNQTHSEEAAGQGFGNLNQLKKSYAKIGDPKLFNSLVDFYFIDNSTAELYPKIQGKIKKGGCQD